MKPNGLEFMLTPNAHTQARGQVERIGSNGSGLFTHRTAGSAVRLGQTGTSTRLLSPRCRPRSAVLRAEARPRAPPNAVPGPDLLP